MASNAEDRVVAWTSGLTRSAVTQIPNDVTHIGLIHSALEDKATAIEVARTETGTYYPATDSGGATILRDPDAAEAQDCPELLGFGGWYVRLSTSTTIQYTTTPTICWRWCYAG